MGISTGGAAFGGGGVAVSKKHHFLHKNVFCFVFFLCPGYQVELVSSLTSINTNME